MTYTSLNFIFFVLATALVYFVLPFKKYRWTVLLAASIFFYCTWSYQLGAFMLFTTLSTYLIALWLNRVSVKSKAVLKEHKSEWSRDDKKKYKNKTKVRMRLVMTLALLLNFGILAFLKYYNFFAGSLNDILGAFSLDFSAPSLKLILPLGISFYTFQSMGYIVDVYREKTAPQKNPLKLLLFVSFFPQIIQGPISIYDQLAVQLFEGHDFDFTRFKHGCELIMWGFFKKLVIADRAVIAITAVTADYNKFGGTTLTFTVLLYALQLYADFSGGIDISRGVAQIFGVDMIDNFKRPYFNAFITASKKMKGTRFGKTAAGAHISKVLPTSVASLIVFLVVGIWHGASWKYVAFGAWNGMIIMVSILLEPLFISAKDKLHIKDTNIPFMLFQMFRTFLIVLVGYVFDVAPSFSQAMRTFWLFFTNQNFKLGYSQISDLGLGKKDYLVVLIGGLIIFIASIIQERAKNGLDIRHMLDQKPFILRFALLFVALISIVVFGIYGSGYSAADFVYAQF